jgi:ABC-type uncharacterized transport system substrate-binding protein
MVRREFLKLSGLAAIAFPWPALAQMDLPLVAVLVPGSADFARQRIDALRPHRYWPWQSSTRFAASPAHFAFEIIHHPIQGLDDIAGAVASSKADGVEALYVSGEPLLYNNMARVLPAVMASGKPTVGTYPEWGRAGLLMSYSADLLDDFRRAGIYAAKILGGEKPGDLPIEQASKFVLVVNVKTAKQLGLNVPPTLLTLADDVIE